LDPADNVPGHDLGGGIQPVAGGDGEDPVSFKCRVFSCCIGQLWLSYRLLVLSSATLGPGFGHHLPAR
jgi:hypothetical protein